MCTHADLYGECRILHDPCDVRASLHWRKTSEKRRQTENNPAASGLRLACLHPLSQKTGSLCMSASTDRPNLSLVHLDSLYRSLCLKQSPLLCAKCVSISRIELPSVHNIDSHLGLQTLPVLFLFHYHSSCHFLCLRVHNFLFL